jgi:hypothetical protein
MCVGNGLGVNAMEITVARGNKGDPGPLEKWSPGRTLDSITKIHLAAEDISEAAQQIAVEDDQREILAEKLQSIARCYWEQHRDLERPPANWYRTKVARLQKGAENLLEVLREPRGTALGQLQFRTERLMGRPLLGSYGQEPISLEQLLDDFVAVCKSCNFSAARGAPNKAHIKAAVASLREVYIKFTGKEFPLNLESGDSRKDRDGRPAAEQVRDDAFASPGPRFVQVMMCRIDPNVRIGAIKTALRDASVNARLVE